MPSNQPIVLLREVTGERYLPIWIGAVEATAIAFAQQGVVPPRPLTHDLIRNLLAEFGAVLERVVIHDLKDSTFYAYLELKRGSEYSRIDVRPSDALALALRTKAPIYVHPRVIERASSSEISTEDADQERLQQWLESLDPDDLGYKM